MTKCMDDYPVIVIGGSAGGLSALLELVHHLPGDLSAAIFVVLHLSPGSPGTHASLLRAQGARTATEARDGDPIRPGSIYMCPPDRHLLIEPGRMTLSHGPRENRQRPAVDPLFRSAARAYGRRVVGIVLSGMLDDGTAGLWAIKARGGLALVQEPAEARASAMPQNAIARVKVDAVLPVAGLARRIVELSQQPGPRRAAPSETGSDAAAIPDDHQTDLELASLRMDRETLDRHEHPGKQSEFACPECGGALWEIRENELTRYRCRVGHALSEQTLLAAQSDAVEDALWVALRALEEKIALGGRMIARNTGSFRQSLMEERDDAMQQADRIRRLLKIERFHIAPEGEPSP